MKKLLLALFLTLTLTACSEDTTDSVDGYDAKVMAEEFVSRNLKAPSTAEFPSPDEISVMGSAGYFTVDGYVDAQNGFGAMIRTYYTIKMSYDSDTEIWTVEDLTFDE